MSAKYVSNHYVPQWHQRRFIPSGQVRKELYYLDLRPDTFVDGCGTRRARKALKRFGPRKCFAEDDLYMTRFRGVESRDLERVFFGRVDDRAKRAVEFFAEYVHDRIDRRALHDLMTHLSTQKLRTPKGLDWLAGELRSLDRNEILRAVVTLQQIYGAIWAECVWQVAIADQTATKFIVTDHPVTVYNRVCGPRNKQWCRGSNDPDIRLHGTHTLYPLSSDRILILTNHSWATNPYQSAVEYRPNPDLMRGAMFNFLDIQVQRHLTEEEVIQINFIMKSRAYRYIAAGREEWLYPERHVSKADWNTYGGGYLLMPDPRPLVHGSEYIVGYSDGSTASLDHLGRLPFNPEFGHESRSLQSMRALDKFKAEFATTYGPVRRGRSCGGGQLDPERDPPDRHEYHLGLGRRR